MADTPDQMHFRRMDQGSDAAAYPSEPMSTLESMVRLVLHNQSVPPGVTRWAP